MDKKSDYAVFSRLYKGGTPKDEIISALGISTRTFYRYVKEYENENSLIVDEKQLPFSFKEYLRAVAFCNGMKKEHVMDFLNVSDRTLHKYERNYMFPVIIPFLEMNGMDKREIERVLKIKSGSEILEYSKRGCFDFDSFLCLLRNTTVPLANPDEIEEIEKCLENLSENLDEIKAISGEIFRRVFNNSFNSNVNPIFND